MMVAHMPHVDRTLPVPGTEGYTCSIRYTPGDNIGIVSWARECQHTHNMHILCMPCFIPIPILSPFLFRPSLYASFLKFVGFFIYL